MSSTEEIRVLVVDDDEMQLSLISRWLQKLINMNVKVLATSNVNQAIGLALAKDIDICLTDLDMPESNGIKLLKAIREGNPLTPVILMTGVASRNALESSFAFGASDYFLKPLNWEDLLTSMRFHIDRLRRFRLDFPLVQIQEETTTNVQATRTDSALA